VAPADPNHQVLGRGVKGEVTAATFSSWSSLGSLPLALRRAIGATVLRQRIWRVKVVTMMEAVKAPNRRVLGWDRSLRGDGISRFFFITGSLDWKRRKGFNVGKTQMRVGEGAKWVSAGG